MKYIFQEIQIIFVIYSVCAICSQSLENQDTGFEFPILGTYNE